MAGNEIDTHATLNDLRTPRANDGGREALLVGFLSAVGLMVFFGANDVSWMPLFAKTVVCLFLPLVLAFTTMTFVASVQSARRAKRAEAARRNDTARKDKQIAEARARGDFDRWNKDE
ncbi:hypothetical protein ROBYS_08150 [Roseobacter sp. OBYS 0001]|nr:hypothetical protein ROBYS_08150 [Roseobacter sp. OBYS 0001]